MFFLLGVTTVTYSALDVVDHVASARQTVRVIDTTPPALPAPLNVTVNAMSPAGAVVCKEFGRGLWVV